MSTDRFHTEHPHHNHYNLIAAARAAMTEHGFDPDFPEGAERELAEIADQTITSAGGGVRDLRHLLWSSIDNDTSKDLDQIEWAERLEDGRIRVLVGVSDVDARVHRGSQLDQHAQSETTSVYTGVKVFPMLPLELSEGATSLNENEDRLAMVIEYRVDEAGTVSEGRACRAVVRNQAQLAYPSVGAWLAGKAEAPAKIAANAQLAEQLRLQDEAARRMLGSRYQHGALDLETIETRPLMQAEEAVAILRLEKNRATSLIEEFMVAANGVIARIFEEARVPSIRRIVRTPKRWSRIVQLADKLGTTLPAEPDSKALNEFLLLRKAKDPEHFPDLSLAVVKLMGPGEYTLVRPDEVSPGHFGLAVQDYTHSTAPNRRFPDMVTLRILKALLTKKNAPYSAGDLEGIAQRCTQMEDAARKVEREMQKRIAAVVLHSHIGQRYRAIVTGVNHYGVFVRTLDPHVEGKLVEGGDGLDVGDRVQVQLVATNPELGFIDFAAV